MFMVTNNINNIDTRSLIRTTASVRSARLPKSKCDLAAEKMSKPAWALSLSLPSLSQKNLKMSALSFLPEKKLAMRLQRMARHGQVLKKHGNATREPMCMGHKS